ncbi:MAG TPA: M20/M25/M40 family metallo-hydrolase [Bacillota bacterium]
MTGEGLRELDRYVDAAWDDLVDFARRLVRTPSISGQERVVAELIRAEMTRLGYDQVFADSTGNVVGVIRGDGRGEHVLYNFHMDHVSPGNPEAWTYPPYEGLVRDGYLHGRGASDVKGAIAAQVYAAALVKKAGLAHGGDIIVTGVVDEEPGDMWGMRRLAGEVLSGYLGRIGLVVLAEATSLDIYLGHRGRAEFEISTLGQIGHSSSPWRGVNAVYLMAPVVEAVRAMADALPEDAFLGKSSAAVTNILASPGWGSIIPDRCTIWVDRRFLPSEDRQSTIAQFKEILARQVPEGRATVAFRQLAHRSYMGIEETIELYKPAFLTDRCEPHVERVRGALTGLGQNPGFGRWDFGTDGALTAVELGLPTIGYSAGEEQYAHQPTDRVSLDLLRKSVHGNVAISMAVTGAGA